MAPKKKCSCKNHDLLSNDESPVSTISTCKKFKKCSIDYLREQGFLEKYHKHLCEVCYLHGLMHGSAAKLTFSGFCAKITRNELDDDQFNLLSCSYGTLLNLKLNGIKSDCTLQNLQGITFESLFNSVDQGIQIFLSNLSGENKPDMRAVNAYEQLVQLANNKYIGPLNFSKNIIDYFISGSRRIVELNSSFSPSGSYATVLEFLKTKAVSEAKILDNVDCIYFFDNNQIMARKWKVQFNSKPLVSVVTTVASLLPPNPTSFQSSVDFMPGNWLSIEGMDGADTFLKRSEPAFRSERISVLKDEIQKHATDNDCTPPAKLRNIDFSSGRPRATPTKPHDPYCDIPSFVCGQTKMVLLPPILVNPCSFKSLGTVLDEIQKSSNNKWVVVGCDGLPYSLCSRMIENYFVCPHCNETFENRGPFNYHIYAAHLNLDDVENFKKYKNILLIPGFGHVDINITKALFKLLWVVCLKQLALLLGWKSVKALSACENCTDHHKATQILDIAYESLVKELLTPFIVHCESLGLEPTPNYLFEFAGEQNANYVFLFKCTFTYLLAWKTFKREMRRSNYSHMKMALDKLSDLFYGLNMTVYMDLWIRFETLMLKAPTEIRQFIEQNITMSQSGHESKAEGGDFILESMNKRIKSFMPQTVPTDDCWTRVCGNLDNIEQIKNALNRPSESGETSQPSPYFRKFKDTDAVAAFSEKVRTYLSQQEHQHTAFDKRPLDNDLVNSDQKCYNNKVSYYQKYPNVTRLCERIFITPEDREQHFDIQNKRKSDIQKMVANLLKEIQDAGGAEEAESLQQQWDKKVKNGTKKEMITFYQELVQNLEEVTRRSCAAEEEMDTHEDN